MIKIYPMVVYKSGSSLEVKDVKEHLEANKKGWGDIKGNTDKTLDIIEYEKQLAAEKEAYGNEIKEALKPVTIDPVAEDMTTPPEYNGPDTGGGLTEEELQEAFKKAGGRPLRNGKPTDSYLKWKENDNR